ncbi:hypothetical protein HLB09_05895, partial [Pseudokineococcus marinus]
GAPGVEAVTVKPGGALRTASPWLIHTLCVAGWPSSRTLRRAWATALEAARPGAHAAVVDTTVARGALPLRVASRAACALGGVDVAAHPWRAVEEELDDVRSVTLARGHVEVRAGVLPRRT